MQVQFKINCLENLSLSNNIVFLISEHDECITNQHNCDENALCFNTVGGHNCVCKPGYTGNGTTCKGKRVNVNTSSIRDNIIHLNLPLPLLIPVIYFLAHSTAIESYTVWSVVFLLVASVFK